jgi:hypothetical protein
MQKSKEYVIDLSSDALHKAFFVLVTIIVLAAVFMIALSIIEKPAQMPLPAPLPGCGDGLCSGEITLEQEYCLPSDEQCTEQLAYSKEITINAATALTNYQVKMIINTIPAIAAGKMQPDCRDIRFYDSTNSKLPYWIESGCNTEYTVIWVKVPSISESTKINMYYGNSSLAAESNGENVFDFFDGFDGPFDTSKWTIENSEDACPITTSFSEGMMNISKNCKQEARLLANTGAGINSTNNYVLRSAVKIGSCISPNLCERVGLGMKTINFTGYSFLLYDFINKDELIFLKDYVPASGGGAIPAQAAYQSSISFNWDFDTAYIVEITKNTTTIKGRINDGEWHSDSTSNIWKDKTGSFALNMGNDTLESASWDYAAIRKFTEIEPTFTAGAEQQRAPIMVVENCSTCPEDCEACPPVCGDGLCNGNENCSICSADCGPCLPACGNNIIESGEQCDPPETACTPNYNSLCIYCNTTCQNVTLIGEYCGDADCNGNENCSICSADCDACPVEEWTTIASISENQSIDGITKVTGEKERVILSIEDEEHYVGVNDTSANSAIIIVASAPQNAALTVGEERKFEVTNDNYLDIYVKLNSIIGGKANLTIQQIHEVICDENWSCAIWGNCINGVQARNCSCACIKTKYCTGDHNLTRSCNMSIAFNFTAPAANESACENECSTGETECISTDAYVSCGNYDDDSCLEWTVKECMGGQRCNYTIGKCGAPKTEAAPEEEISIYWFVGSLVLSILIILIICIIILKRKKLAIHAKKAKPKKRRK